MKRILLDMDGTIVNLHYALLEHFHRQDLIVNYPKGQIKINEILGLSKQDFWNSIPRGFFEHLEPMHDFAIILEIVRRHDPLFHICTSPGKQKPWLVHEKVRWVHKYIDPNFNRFIITKDKAAIASSRHVLIDDWDKEVDNFTSEGGLGLLIPRPWNSEHQYSNQAIFIIQQNLEWIYKS